MNMPAEAPVDAPPQLAGGVELIGPYRGSGSVEVPYLVRRHDGRVVALSPLLYLLAATVDGQRDVSGIAAQVSASSGRRVSVENVAYLIEHKLRPFGVMAGDGEPASPSSRPALALTVRRAVIPEGVVRAASTVLRPLFLPGVVGAVLVGWACLDAWLVTARPATPGLQEVLRRPGLFLLVCALTVLSGGFHELGHATAGRCGGARPGVIGVGIYLIWPAFFSDLTDSYRLSRAGRIRADLGGVYFNVVFILGLAGAYAVTGARVLLLVIFLQHLMVLNQFLPFLRLDGYYVVSDLAGVPDLFARVRPVLAGLVPGRRRSVPSDLKPLARAVVTAWVLSTVTLMTAMLALLAVRLPDVVLSTASFVHGQAMLVSALMREGDSAGLAAALRLALLAIPLAGLTVPATRLVRASLARRARRAPTGEPHPAPSPAGPDWYALARVSYGAHPSGSRVRAQGGDAGGGRQDLDAVAVHRRT